MAAVLSDTQFQTNEKSEYQQFLQEAKKLDKDFVPISFAEFEELKKKAEVMEKIQLSGIDNEATQQVICKAFNDKKFNLLQRDTDKIRELSALIVPNLPMIKNLEATHSVEGQNLDFSEIKPIIEKQILFENLYTTSLLSDFSNKKISPITEQLKSFLVDNYMKLNNFSDEKMTLEQAKSGLEIMIDEPLAKIAKSLEIGKEKSFLERLF